MPEVPPVFVIDGARFDDLEGFWDEVERVLIPGAKWGRNLDALADVLGGGFGTPAGGFVVRWVNAGRSRELLGFTETARWLDQRLSEVHASNRAEFARRLEHARKQRGETMFEALIDIFRTASGVTFVLVD